ALFADQVKLIGHLHTWQWQLPSLARIHRLRAKMCEVTERQPSAPPPVTDRSALTEEVRRESARLRLSQVGFAAFDEKYVFGEAGRAPDRLRGAAAMPVDGGSVIVCLLEQDWARTQMIPSAASEREVIRVYEGIVDRASKLARFLQDKGFRAEV